MKIVRLESDDSAVQSIFTNNLSIPVTLSKNGQVALKTLTIDFTLDNIVINETNNVLDVEFIGGDIYNVQLIKGVYSNTSLLEMLNNQFNKYLKSIQLIFKISKIIVSLSSLVGSSYCKLKLVIKFLQ